MSLNSKSEPVCSVCIANYNGIGVIGACIDSVLAQECDFPFEIIIHDDASTDNSAAFIREHYRNVTLIRGTENVGFCISNNRMVTQALGEYILLLNNDAILCSNALHILHNYARNQLMPSILGLPQYDAGTGKLIDMGSLFGPFLNPVPNLNPDREDVAMITGACLWMPKRLWNEIGGFPEWFHALSEDMYLCCLARLKGNPVRALSRSGFKHWVGRSLGGGKIRQNRLATSLKRRTLSERNKSFVMALCYPPPFFQLLFPLHIFLLLMEGVLLAAIKSDLGLLNSIYLACLKSLWRERHRLLHLRCSIQKSRRIKARQFFSAFVFMPHKLRMLFKHGVPEIK